MPIEERKLVHRGYLLVTLACFVLSALTFKVAIQAFRMPRPGPGPKSTSMPIEDDTWSVAAGVATAVFGFGGLLSLVATFATGPQNDDTRED